MGLENPLHIAVLVVILLLVFGARRLPEIGRSLGSGMREFKDSITGESKQHTIGPGAQATQDAAQPPAAAAPAPPAPAAPQAPAAPAPQAPAPAQPQDAEATPTQPAPSA
jgi:sec-independent protein translocase protein TatA